MIQKLSRNDFDKVFKLMERSFPEDEYRTYEEQKALLDNAVYQIYIIPDSESDDIKAFIAVWEFESIAYIDHFVVNPVYRNGGIGSKMLSELANLLKKMICLEVELPDNELAARRINFYERNNFFLNEYPYMQPPISAGRESIPLLIMTSGKSVNSDEFDKIKTLLYTQVYNQI